MQFQEVLKVMIHLVLLRLGKCRLQMWDESHRLSSQSSSTVTISATCLNPTRNILLEKFTQHPLGKIPTTSVSQHSFVLPFQNVTTNRMAFQRSKKHRRLHYIRRDEAG